MAIDDGESAVLLVALRRIAEARGGIGKLAQDTGLAREALDRTLSVNNNPRLTSLRAILDASGLRLVVAPSRARKTENALNKLLGADKGKRLNTKPAPTAYEVDTVRPPLKTGDGYEISGR